MDEKLYFKENLYYLRTTNNLSQLELAKLLGVSRSAITRWEQGVRMPIVDAAVIIAKYFNVSDKFERYTDNDPIKKEMNFYTLEEFTQFISVIDDLKYQALFILLFYNGLR